MRELLGRGEVLGKEARRIDGDHAACVLEREQIGHEVLGDAGGPGTQASGFGTITGNGRRSAARRSVAAP